ncbi:TetR/AcrR family transcriptional regulator [Arthrobacter sp. HMWF013]|uniref:TetR/AcrR family transcriptional regulator n=1 Tax=Arthrobacter sp. HMWF013 TaxID=2056849 RepID=UPI000D384AF1|nr:TetR/AcrR family transcriptional regulator [Arthrobacter sp. HMWF013]PTT62874.1 TetR/AcrR family transcriptional regulator [Arthrobacter sp. HMWF013]
MTRDASRPAAGRPRLSGAPTGSPRQDIIREAIALFVAKGYAETTMSEIARSAGLRQSSLYYWFARKDNILQALLEENRSSLALATALEAQSGAAAPRLYAVLHADVMQLCSAPLDFYEFERVARSQPQNFGAFFDDYAALHRLTASIVHQGVSAGEFLAVDSSDVATAALGLNEGLQRHYRQPLPGLRSYSAEQVSELSADTSLARLLAIPESLPEIRMAARGITSDWNTTAES